MNWANVFLKSCELQLENVFCAFDYYFPFLMWLLHLLDVRLLNVLNKRN